MVDVHWNQHDYATVVDGERILGIYEIVGRGGVITLENGHYYKWHNGMPVHGEPGRIIPATDDDDWQVLKKLKPST